MKRTSAVDAMFANLSRQVASNRQRIGALENLELAGSAFSMPISTLADAPLAANGLTTYAMRFISNGRKGGEGAGLGTGVPAYYNPATDTWLTFSGNAAVTV